jgi:hypothetical protein
MMADVFRIRTVAIFLSCALFAAAQKAENPKNDPQSEPEDNRPRTRVVPDGPVQGADSQGPPKLKRGKPAPRPSSDISDTDPSPEPVTGPARPSIRRDADAPPPRSSGDEKIEKARQVAVEYLAHLPNYIANQLTTRYESETMKVQWRARDTVSCEVIYLDGKESYRNMAVNGKPTNKTFQEIGGAWSMGEFATVLGDLFDPGTAAEFKVSGVDTISNRPSLVYNFNVDKAHSRWQVSMEKVSMDPAYKGTVWIDRETFHVMRIEMQARNLPTDFPLDKVEMVTEYDFVKLSGTEPFLLPTHAENLACQRGTPYCSRNTIDFRNYRKFGAESTIQISK